MNPGGLLCGFDESGLIGQTVYFVIEVAGRRHVVSGMVVKELMSGEVTVWALFFPWAHL